MGTSIVNKNLFHKLQLVYNNWVKAIQQIFLFFSTSPDIVRVPRMWHSLKRVVLESDHYLFRKIAR